MLNARLLGLFLSILPLWVSACAADGDPGDVEGDVEGDGDGSGDGDGDGDGGDAECESEIVEMPTEPGCAAATATCIEPCETDECFDNCLTADPDPEGCSLCIDDAYVACGNGMGCQVDWDALLCCFDQCADPESAECETSCAAEIGTYETCLESVDEVCGEAVTFCFQS